MSISALALAFVVPLLLSGSQQPPGSPDMKTAEFRAAFERRLERISSDLRGVVGYTIVDVRTGDRFERLATETFPTASTIKLAVLYELFRQHDAGAVRLDEVRPLDPGLKVGGSGVLKELAAPSMSLRDYATLMIVLSDNTATNLIIDTLGLETVGGTVKALGLRETKLRRRMMDAEAAKRGDENVATPAELAALLEALHRGDGLQSESRQALLDILQKDTGSALRRGVGTGVTVASKSGTLDGVAADAGIVYVPDRPYVVVVMATYLAAADEGSAAIEAVSAAAFEYFSTLAASSEYGRRLR